jgi:hypothetical protein
MEERLEYDDLGERNWEPRAVGELRREATSVAMGSIVHVMCECTRCVKATCIHHQHQVHQT